MVVGVKESLGLSVGLFNYISRDVLRGFFLRTMKTVSSNSRYLVR